MRTISFFNEKGGVGKSVHTVMFASYLAYQCGAKVLVIDFEFPFSRLQKARDVELKHLENPDSVLSRYFAENGRSGEMYLIKSPLENKEFSYVEENSTWLRDVIWNLYRSSNFDYILFDFPGQLLKHSPAYTCISSGQVDLVAVPFDTDPTTRKASFATCAFLKKHDVEFVTFWNNVSPAEMSRKGFLDVGEKLFKNNGFEVMPHRIKSFVKARRDSSEVLFVRSSLCWPRRYVEMACPVLPEFYAALKERLDAKRFDKD